MEAASRGAKQANGITIGVLPEHEKSRANPYVDIVITTGLGFARNYINIVSSDAVISIGGSGGTLSEIGYAIALQKQLILLTGTGGVTDIIAQNRSVFTEAKIQLAKSAKEAVNFVFSERSK